MGGGIRSLPVAKYCDEVQGGLLANGSDLVDIDRQGLSGSCFLRAHAAKKVDNPLQNAVPFAELQFGARSSAVRAVDS